LGGDCLTIHLDFMRRTLPELVLSGDDKAAWWEGLGGLSARFGIQMVYLDQAEIEGLTRRMIHPDLNYNSSNR
jgi:hypothetical protein